MKSKIVRAGLSARPVRTSVSILAVALEVTLILTIVGLTNGITTEMGKRTEGVGADIMFQSPNSSLLLALSNSTLPIAFGDKLREIEGVKAVAPIQLQVNSSAGLEVIYGIDSTFDEITGGFTWYKGGSFTAPYDVIVDDIYARSKNIHVGDEPEILNHKFRVVGIVEHGKGARLYIPLATAHEMTGAANRVSLFYVKLNNPNQLDDVMKRMNDAFPTYRTFPMKDYAKLMMGSNKTALDAFIQTVVFISVCVGVLVIFLSMYTTITERTREIGILRSMGGSKQFIVSLIFQETAVVCLLGIFIGILASLAIAHAVTAIFPTLLVLITLGWIAKSALLALFSGFIGSLYPSLKAAAQDPVDALAYE